MVDIDMTYIVLKIMVRKFDMIKYDIDTIEYDFDVIKCVADDINIVIFNMSAIKMLVSEKNAYS